MVPKGWKLVPEEPTAEMLKEGAAADWVGENESRAGDSILPDSYEDWDNDRIVNRPGIWKAMLTASPQPPQVAPMPGEEEIARAIYDADVHECSWDQLFDSEQMPFLTAARVVMKLLTPQTEGSKT